MCVLRRGGGMWAPKSPSRYRKVDDNALLFNPTETHRSRSPESVVTMPEWLVTIPESEKFTPPVMGGHDHRNRWSRSSEYATEQQQRSDQSPAATARLDTRISGREAGRKCKKPPQRVVFCIGSRSPRRSSRPGRPGRIADVDLPSAAITRGRRLPAL